MRHATNKTARADLGFSANLRTGHVDFLVPDVYPGKYYITGELFLRLTNVPDASAILVEIQGMSCRSDNFRVETNRTSH